MRTSLAKLAARSAGLLSRGLTNGGATSLPGLVGLRLDPQLVERASRGLAGRVVVTGTNGKTTTARFIGQILATAGHPVVHNQAGSNLLRGIASALSQHRLTAETWGLFEVDEATMPAACQAVQPDLVVVTNLFRDQLDRYGELERTAEYLRQGLATLPRTSTVILNADDPLVASLGKGLSCRVEYFGLEDRSVGRSSLPHAADSLIDPASGELLSYGRVFVGHLGHYRSKGLKRPKPQVAARAVKLRGLQGSSVTWAADGFTLKAELAIPGLYNVYNAAAAVAAGIALGIKSELITQALAGTTAAFGRVELIPVGNQHLFIGLIKNPTGANEVIHTIGLDRTKKDYLVLINDNFADGQDISWLWDADFEELLPTIKSITVGGTRAQDMALRLKYAGVPEKDVRVRADIDDALDLALNGTKSGGTVYALPTYTAMLGLRKELKKRGVVDHYLKA